MSGKLTKKGKNPGAVDNWLDTLGLYRKNVAYDETCLFRAISEQLFDCQFYHERVRKDCIDYGRKNHHQFKHLEKDERKWNERLDMLVKHMAVCGTMEIHLIAMKYNRDVIVFDALHQDVIEVTKKDLPDPLLLCLMDEDHYDAVYQRDFIETAGFCQAIVYKLLYQDLFGIPNVDDIVNSMLYDKTSVPTTTEINDAKKEINNNDTSSGDETEHNPEMSVSTNIAPFPFKVAKALDPTIYRNIEYDSWGEVRRELRLGDWYYGDDKLILGTRCVLNDSLRNEKHDCYIQEIIKDKNKCVVYLTKLAEKRTVNYADLSPENDAKPWPLPYRFSKNLVIAPPSPITEKVTKANLKKRNKDKRRTKSCGESSVMSEAVGNVEGAENVNPYVGIPLQMHNPNDAAYRQQTNETNSKTETADVQGTSEVAQETQNNNRYQQWEPPQWQPYLTPTPDPYIWPQTPTTPQNMFNFAVKPMVASAPVTPDVMSFYDPNYHYYYNYSPYPVDPNANYTQWMTPTPEYTTPQYTTPQPPPQDIPQTTEETNKNCKTPNSVEVSHPYVPNQSETSEAPSHPERPTLCLQPPTTYQEVYSPMIPIAPGTPVIYTTPEMTEMMMPTTPITVFTPPVDVQYIQPAPFVYPPTPPTAWYPTGINSQGFIFPTVMNAPNIPK